MTKDTALPAPSVDLPRQPSPKGCDMASHGPGQSAEALCELCDEPWCQICGNTPATENYCARCAEILDSYNPDDYPDDYPVEPEP